MIAVETLVAIAILCFAVKGLITDSAYAVRGQTPPRVRARMKALEAGVTGGAQYGMAGYLTDLWHDAWIEARRRREAKLAQPRSAEQRTAGMRRFLARRWNEAWETAEAKHQARRAKKTTDAQDRHECPHCRAGQPHNPAQPATEPRDSSGDAEPDTAGDVRDSGPARPPEYDLYEGQPFGDATGIPQGVTGQPCGHDGCDGVRRAVPGTQHFDADGGAMAETVCTGCGIRSAAYWTWTDHPPAENPDYFEPDEYDDEPDDGRYIADPQQRVDAVADAAPDYVRPVDPDGERPDTPVPCVAPVIPIRFTTPSTAEEETSMGNPVTAMPGEVTGLTTALDYAEGMKSAYQDAAANVELFTASLEGHGVSGEAIAAAHRAAEMQMAAAAAWAEAHAALSTQTGVKEAYLAAPGAGTREFVLAE